MGGGDSGSDQVSEGLGGWTGRWVLFLPMDLVWSLWAGWEVTAHHSTSGTSVLSWVPCAPPALRASGREMLTLPLLHLPPTLLSPLRSSQGREGPQQAPEDEDMSSQCHLHNTTQFWE